MKRSILIAVAALIGLNLASPVGAAIIRTQNFNADPGWASQLNLASPNSYGFQNTTHITGSTAGEAGGTYGRTNTFAYYADPNVSLGANELIQLTGKLTIDSNAGQQGGIRIGWFDNRDYAPGGPLAAGPIFGTNDFVGFVLQDPSGSGGRFRAVLRMIRGNGSDQNLQFTTGVLPGFDYNFDFVYNPLANSGNGQLALSLTGIDDLGFTTNLTFNLPAGFRTGGTFEFNSFGLSTLNFGALTGTSTIFLDDLAYSVPEPSTLALLALAAGSIWLRRKR